MSIEKLINKIRFFSSKVKAASNIATLLFLAIAAYTISQWHKAGDFDNFINLLLIVMLLGADIRFYWIYLELKDAEKLMEEPEIRLVYKLQKKEYSQWLLGSLFLLAVIFSLKMLLV